MRWWRPSRGNCANQIQTSCVLDKSVPANTHTHFFCAAAVVVHFPLFAIPPPPVENWGEFYANEKKLPAKYSISIFNALVSSPPSMCSLLIELNCPLSITI